MKRNQVSNPDEDGCLLCPETFSMNGKRKFQKDFFCAIFFVPKFFLPRPARPPKMHADKNAHTWTRTRVSGFKVQSDNHYTIRARLLGCTFLKM
jgi:hypothetical protein